MATKLVIIGGVAGGAGAAARARRLAEKASITLFEKGPLVSTATCGYPFYVGGEITDKQRLALQTPESLSNALNVDVRARHEVININLATRSVTVKNCAVPKGSPGSTFEALYDNLLIATGAAPMIPPITGLSSAMASEGGSGRVYTLRTQADAEAVLAATQRSRSGGAPGSAVVIGAGFIGLEMVEALVAQGMRVTVVEARASMLPQMDAEMTGPIANELAMRGVRVLAATTATAFATVHDGVRITLSSGEELTANFAVLSIGVRPESALAAAAGLKLDPATKAIVVDEHQRTSDPNVYAVGDVCASPHVLPRCRPWLALGGPANRQARLAVDSMFLGAAADTYRGSFGTSIVRAFDVVAGMTGWMEGECIARGIPYETQTVSGFSHASYYPGAVPITVKVIYTPTTGELLGGQVVGGHEGVDKRLDVLSTALHGRMCVEDLSHLDLAYAPPFGSARDVINTAGFAAGNARLGLLRSVTTLPTSSESPSAPLVLDVRDADSVAAHPLPPTAGVDVMCVPQNELRGRIEEIKGVLSARPNHSVVTVCALGKMSYFGARILAASDIEARSLSGGITWMRGQPLPTITVAAAAAAASAAPKSPALKTIEMRAQPEAPPSSLDQSSPMSIGFTGHVLIDATGLACPGPIREIHKALNATPPPPPGTVICVTASDPGFFRDFPAFVRATDLELLGVEKKGRGLIEGRARIPGGAAASCSVVAASAVPATVDSNEKPSANRHDVALVVFSGEMDKVMAALVIANGAVAMGGRATLFFTFWGLEALKKEHHHARSKATARADGNGAIGSSAVSMPPPEDHLDHPHKSLLDRILGAMLPSGISSLPLSHLNMHGAGPVAMRLQMKMKHLPTLPGLLEDARASGKVRLVGCTMSMAALGVDTGELLDGVELGGVADFLEAAGKAHTTLFI